MKRFINCHIPVTTCNLRCPYCYITQNKLWDNKLPCFEYSPEHIAKALSVERLGGICHLNICGDGETLLPPEVTKIVKCLLMQGHSIFIVTNGLITSRFLEISQWPDEYIDRLGLKFSFHYSELKRLNKVDVFFENVKNMRDRGVSISVELTPSDEIVKDIGDIIELCNSEVGASCHVTVPRNDHLKEKSMMTRFSKKDYINIWRSFNSELFDFKISTFGVKRKEYCYAGDWSFVLNMGTGDMSYCYGFPSVQNIFNDLSKPIVFAAVGKSCKLSHCINSHAFMTLGVIPKIYTPSYASMRNKVTKNGDEWLGSNMSKCLNKKLISENHEYDHFEKIKAIVIRNMLLLNKYSNKLLKYVVNKIMRV